MANTKVTQHVIANNAITADQISSAAVTDAKLHATLDLSGKTLTLPSAQAATTQSASDNSTKLATTAYVTTAIANLNDSAPTALNTLNELAAALGDDANFSGTITTSLAGKLPLAGGTMTGDLILGDNVQLEIGSASGGDMQIYHSGTNSHIKETGTGGLILNSDSLYLMNGAGSQTYFYGRASDGQAELRFGNAAKLATSSYGVDIQGTGALKIPVGTTGQRPTAATGQLRFNSTDGKLEIYDGSAWSNVSAGTSNKVLDTFTGDNSTTAFTLTETPANEDALMVFINGAYQEKGDYSLSGKVLTLDVAPLSAEKVVVHTTIGAVHDGTAALNQQFTATAGQTAFTLGVDPQHENNTQVYINGVYQQKTDYTVVGTTLTFDTGLTVGDVVEVNSFTVTNLGGSDSVTEGVSNLYHTTARARAVISVTGNAIGYDSSTGVITANFEEGPTFTGTVTSAGLAVDTTTLVVDPTNNRVGIGTTAPTMPLSVQAASNAYAISMHGRSDGYSELYGASNDGSTKYSFLQAHSAQTKLYTLVNTPLLFGTNSTERMRISNTGRVGIGTGSPQAHLDINTEAAEATTVILNGEANQDKILKFRHYGNSEAAPAGYSGFIGSVVDDVLTLGHYTSTNTEVQVLHITEGGDVGIGVTDPDGKLHVETAGNANVYVERTSGAKIHLQAQSAFTAIGAASNHDLGLTTNASVRMRIDNTGRVGINRIPAISNSKLEVGGADNTPLINVEASGATAGVGIGSSRMKFYYGTAEKASIDSSGNLRTARQIIQENSDGTPRFINIPFSSAGSGFTFNWDDLANHSAVGDQSSETNAFMFEVNVTSYLFRRVKALIIVDTNSTNSIAVHTIHNSTLTCSASIPTGSEQITITIGGLWSNAVNYMGRITTF